MINLLLKVNKITKNENNTYYYECKDKFGIDYDFKFTCYKHEGSYILVNVDSYNISLLDYNEVIDIKVKYIKNVNIINGKLNAKSDILKEVYNYINSFGDIEELEIKIKDIRHNGMMSSESWEQTQIYDKRIRKYETAIKRLKMINRVA